VHTYNWKGNVSTMGSCTVNYNTNNQSSSCEDSTVDMMKTVEQYFEMELYYCGLSLTDLQAEIK
jgi:2-hydroxy-3-keto-5-methylthiopentenyl-1-phosphate phosphatase